MQYLDENLRTFLRNFVRIPRKDVFICYECNETYFDAGNESCQSCGNTLFRKQMESELEIRDSEIKAEVAKRIHDFESYIGSSGQTQIMELQSTTDKLRNENDSIRSTFQLVDSIGSALSHHYYEFFTYCLGNGNIPPRVNEYLLNCILVTYGQSELSGREHFGTLNLHDFLENDNPEEQFATAVQESLSGLRNRVTEHASSAHSNLTSLQEKVDNSEILDSNTAQRKSLKSEYGFDDFERDIFYLFKQMFLFTERWGREGKKESDGCLVIPKEKGDYFVASYDPKLTYDPRGYDLNASEKNKVAYYILSQENNKYIKNTLKDGGGIDSHIILSDIFRTGQYEHVASTLDSWLSLTKGSSEEVNAQITFLPLDRLLDIYSIFRNNYADIFEYDDVQNAFRREIINKFGGNENWREINSEDINSIRATVIEAKSSVSRKRNITDYRSK